MRSDLAALDRVHVIGGMGTGKTFLARRLGVVLDAPVYEMDLGIEQSELLDQPRSICEGIHLWDVDDLLDAADVVVWLDLPYRTCVRRVVVRHALASARGDNRHKGLRKLGRFVLASRRYWSEGTPRPPAGPTDWDALTRAQTVLTLEPFGEKLVHLRTRAEVDRWLETVRPGRRRGGVTR